MKKHDEDDHAENQKRRQNNGADFEKRIIASCARYRLRGLARIEKVATPFKTIRQGRKLLAIPCEKSTVDFMGMALVPHLDGVTLSPVAFEAKHCSKTSFSLAEVKPNQSSFLRDWHAMGGIAFVLLEMAGEVYRIDWSEFAGLEDELGRKSIPAAWLEKRVPCPRGSQGEIDFLSAIVA